MAPRCGCGSTTACSCRILAGTNVTVTGTGSPTNPFIIGSTAGLTCYGNPRMTRAAALALRAGADLVVGCPVVITDGPTIGVVGFTSPTEIELQPVSATEFGFGALVHTNYESSAWVGQYDIDLLAGTLFELSDSAGNLVRDPKDGDLVQTKFPWGFVAVESNRIINPRINAWVTLPGWGVAATAGAVIRGNDITTSVRDTVVDLTGFVTGGTPAFFLDNTIRDGRVVFSTPLPQGSIFSSNVVRDDFRLLVAPTGTTTSIQIDGNEFSDRLETSAVNDMEITISSGSLVMNNSRFRAQSIVVQYAIGGAGGLVEFFNSTFSGGGMRLTRGVATTSRVSFIDSEFNASVLTLNGTDFAVEFQTVDLLGGTVTRDQAATSGLAVRFSDLKAVDINQHAGATSGVLEIETSQLAGSAFDQNGPGAVVLAGVTDSGSNISNTPSATRGLILFQCVLTGATITQQRTLNANLDTIEGCSVRESTVNITGAGGLVAAMYVVYASTVADGALITVTDPAATMTMTATQVFGNSGLTVAAGGSASYSRICNGAVVNTGAFAMTNAIVEGLFTKTATANNANTLTNKSFDDWV